MSGFGGGGSGGGGSTITGTLTPPHIPVATGAHTLGDSIITQPNGIVITGTANAKQLEVIGNATQTSALASFERSTSIPAFQLFASSGFQGSSWEGMEHTGSTYTMAMLNDWTGAELSGLGVGANGLVLSSAYQVSWGDTVNDIFGNVTDTGLKRASAGIVAVTNGATTKEVQLGFLTSPAGYGAVWGGNITASDTNYSLASHGVTYTVVNTPDSASGYILFRGAGSFEIASIASNSGASILSVGSTSSIAWASTATSLGTLDTGLQRSSAGIVKFTAGSSGNGGFLSQLGSSVIGHADEVQLTVMGHSTQTANLMEWKFTGGSKMASFVATSAGTGQINFPNQIYISTGSTSPEGTNANCSALIYQGSYYTKGSGLFGWASSANDLSGSIDTALTRAAAASVRITDASTGIGSLLASRVIQTNTTGPVTITATQSGTVFNNSGAGGSVAFNLPTAAAGLVYCFAVITAQNVVVTASAGDVIYLGSTASSVAGTATSNTIGSFLYLVAIDATNWLGILSGVWTPA